MAPKSKAKAKAKKSKEDIGDAIGAIKEATEKGNMTTEQLRVAARRAVTGVLASAPTAMDVKFESFSMQVSGNQLVSDTSIELNQGCRYGLIGDNGSGKSNVLASIAQRDLPLPNHIDVFHLHEEAAATDMTAVEAVLDHIVQETARLEELSAKIMEECGPDDERIEAITYRLDELDTTDAEPRARKILAGLGFIDAGVPMDKQTKHMSGGWRMRVSLAKALFASPSLLLLDEPTNHLDLEACVWLEDHLSKYKKCLFVISHSQDFLNTVCSHTVWLHHTNLTYYGGNYAAFVKTVEAEEQIRVKIYEKQQADMDKLADFVRVNKANGVASSAKSKKKVLEKIQDDAVEKPKVRQQTLTFKFDECDRLEPPVMPFEQVCFSYSGKKEEYLYKDLDLAIDCDSRVALVGPNGCGKSTLVKLMSGELNPTEGAVKRHQHLMLGYFHQHSSDVLELNLSPLAFMKKLYPPSEVKRSEETWRAYLTMFGFNGKTMLTDIGMLSDGQKTRLVFAIMGMKPYNVLLLDEPTNHLDVDAVNGLADAIRTFQGGVVLVSHDFRLIDQVAKEIWVCKDKGVEKFDGTIHEYKNKLSKKMEKHRI